jgi:hypothetical protein
MCLLLVLSSITPSLIKCKYNIVLKLEKRFFAQDVIDALGLVSLEEICPFQPCDYDYRCD